MAAVSSIAVGALVVSAVAGVGSAGYSAYQGRQQQKEAKKEQRAQQQEINQSKKEAGDKRKGLIEQQRYQMGFDSDYNTTGTSPTGMTTGSNSTLG